MAFSGMLFVKSVGIAAAGAGVGLLAGLAIKKAASSVSMGGQELITAGVGAAALAGATAWGRPVLGMAVGAPLFYMAGGSFLMRQASVQSALASAGLGPAAPAPAPSLPATT